MEIEKRFILKEEKAVELKVPPLDEEQYKEAIKPFNDFLQIQHTIMTAIIDTENESLVNAVNDYLKEHPNLHINTLDKDKLEYVIACYKLLELIPNEVLSQIKQQLEKDKQLEFELQLQECKGLKLKLKKKGID